MSVTVGTIRQAIGELGLSRQPLCVHSSLRSFGWVEGGAAAVVNGLLAEGCTVIVPSFSWDAFAIPPPADCRPRQNGTDYAPYSTAPGGIDSVYTSASTEIDHDLGAIPATVVAMAERRRGYHPLCSFSAIGPLAEELIREQAPLDVFAPLQRLADLGGSVILMGVGLERLTLIHLAEKLAGRRLFLRFANGLERKPIAVEVGGCSEGFVKLEPLLAPLIQQRQVGESAWKMLPAAAALDAAARAIAQDPAITHCGDSHCQECRDAMLGGPIPG